MNVGTGRITAALCLAALLIAPGVRAAELRLSGGELAVLLQRAFNGTTILLHTDPQPRAMASFIRLGPQLQGQYIRFSMPVHQVSLGFGGEAEFVMNDINSNPAFRTASGAPFGQNIAVGATPQFFVLSVRFEEEGVEIIGRPDGWLAQMRGDFVPDFDFRNTTLQIILAPYTARGGRGVAFRPSRVALQGDIQARGVGQISFLGRRVDLLDSVTQYKTRVKTAVEREVAKLIDQNLSAVASSMNQEIYARGRSLGVNVASIRFEGTGIVIAGRL